MRFSHFLLALVVALFPAPSAGADPVPLSVHVTSKYSLLHLGSIDSFDITEGGIRAALLLHEALESGDGKLAAQAEQHYEKLIPNENFGGEYTALKWFCEYLTAPEDRRSEMTRDPFVAAFHGFFSESNYAILREYLERKYRLRPFGYESRVEDQRRLGFLEDFILFNNPRREQWEKTSKIMEVLDIKPGETIADIGSGPGYYTFKFSELVGPEGYVHAIDVNPMHNAFVRRYAQDRQISNVGVVRSEIDHIGLAPKSVDLAFSCSLYHIIYTTFTEEQKDNFIRSIRDSLKDNGRLVIVDNGLVKDDTLPYHGPYIARELIENQLHYYGFQLTAAHQFIPQRYVLVFEKRPSEFSSPGQTVSGPGVQPDAPGKLAFDDRGFLVEVHSKLSLVHIPNHTIPDVTEGGREAARWFYKALATGSREAAEEARQWYRRLIPLEKVGGEYTAFAWFCDYLVATPETRQEMLKDPLVASYYRAFSENDFEVLKNFLLTHYQLEATEDDVTIHCRDQGGVDPEPQNPLEPDENQTATDMKITQVLALSFLNKTGSMPQREEKLNLDQLTYWRDLLLFNNPRREDWEKTSRILEALALKPGQTVADIGSGPGYYSFMFSRRVGPEGRVYAVETNKQHLDYIEQVKGEVGAGNVQTVLAELNDCKLPGNSADMVFLCSVYAFTYATAIEKVKDSFVESIHRALKPQGRLVLVDNAVVDQPVVPYHGPYLDRRLVIAQLTYLGFRLVEEYQFIPQRYVLIFEKVPLGGEPSARK